MDSLLHGHIRSKFLPIKMKNLKFLLIVSVLIFSVGCRKSKVNDSTELPSGFLLFYDKFHNDSIYQINHIRFPLEGIPTLADTNEITDFHWGLEGWNMHKPFDKEGDFVRNFVVVDSALIIETIRLKNNEYGMERRWSKSGSEWQLIYYASMNKLVRNPDLK